jgi:hypothetical protein
MLVMGTVLALAGPKRVGKSWLAESLATLLDIHHLDPDAGGALGAGIHSRDAVSGIEILLAVPSGWPGS